MSHFLTYKFRTFVFIKESLLYQGLIGSKKLIYWRKRQEDGRLFKFEIGQTVELKRPHPMAGLIGVVRASYEENRTYLVYFNHDYQLILHENQLEIKKG